MVLLGTLLWFPKPHVEQLLIALSDKDSPRYLPETRMNPCY